MENRCYFCVRVPTGGGAPVTVFGSSGSYLTQTSLKHVVRDQHQPRTAQLAPPTPFTTTLVAEHPVLSGALPRLRATTTPLRNQRTSLRGQPCS
eukprot:4861201-Karenia_brevis.AAC.1